MFEYLAGVGRDLHNEMVAMYWILLVPFLAFLLLIEILKDEHPNIRDILRRLVVSVILLYSFDWTVDTIAIIGDAVTERINGLEKLSEVLANLGPNYSGHDSWFNLRETAIYIFSLAAYIIAYVGFFTATALTHFVWTILYVSAPLMILMYLSRHTSSVTISLYKGLIQVVVWKIFWSILGVLLLKLAIQPQVSGFEDYLMAIVVNLCIGVSMLFIPVATRSLISDGMSSFAGTLAAVPALAAGGAIKLGVAKLASRIKGASLFATRPMTNPITGRYEMLKDRLKPRVQKAIRSYENFGLPKEILEKRKLKPERKKPYAEES